MTYSSIIVPGPLYFESFFLLLRLHVVCMDVLESLFYSPELYFCSLFGSIYYKLGLRHFALLALYNNTSSLRIPYNYRNQLQNAIMLQSMYYGLEYGWSHNYQQKSCHIHQPIYQVV